VTDDLSDLNIKRAHEVGRKGNAWCVEATCPICGFLHWVEAKSKWQTRMRSKTKCVRCHTNDYKTATFKNRTER
jgi:hypothetical protein